MPNTNGSKAGMQPFVIALEKLPPPENRLQIIKVLYLLHPPSKQIHRELILLGFVCSGEFVELGNCRADKLGTLRPVPVLRKSRRDHTRLGGIQ